MTANMGRRLPDDDLFVLAMVGFLALAGAVGAAATWWTRTVGWLLTHRVIVAASEHPVLVLPGGGGTGLDGPRLALAAAAALLAPTAVVSAVRSRLRARATQ